MVEQGDPVKAGTGLDGDGVNREVGGRRCEEGEEDEKGEEEKEKV